MPVFSWPHPEPRQPDAGPGSPKLRRRKPIKESNKEMMDTARRDVARAAWRLARDYWTSEERRSAWALLAAVVALNLGNVYISVQINRWNSAFYNALQAFDRAGLFRQLG